MTPSLLLIAAAVILALLIGLLAGLRLARRRRMPVPTDDPRTGEVDWASLRYVERVWELPEAREDSYEVPPGPLRA